MEPTQFFIMKTMNQSIDNNLPAQQVSKTLNNESVHI